MSSILDLINNLDRSRKILVIGHKKPDTDTIFSSYLMSKVLQSLGYDALYAVLDGEKISEDCTKQVMDNFDYSPFILDKKGIYSFTILFFLLFFEFLKTCNIGNILRTHIFTTSAANTHMVSKSFLII